MLEESHRTSGRVGGRERRKVKKKGYGRKCQLMRPVVYEALDCGQKSLTLVLRCRQLLFGLLAIGHLSRMSRQSRLSANDKGDNEVIPVAVPRSPYE